MADRDDQRRAPAGHDGEADGAEPGPDAAASPDEAAASARLRDRLAALGDGGPDAEGDDALALVASLRAAWAPEPLDPTTHRELVDELPDAAELASAAALRDALAGDAPSEAATLAASLRAAWAPTELDANEHRAIVDAALAKVPARRADAGGSERRARVIRLTFGVVTGGLALAASILLVVTTGDRELPLARARTTQPLFHEPFKAGETSARIDRIASARASDYRDNRFAKWGVK